MPRKNISSGNNGFERLIQLHIIESFYSEVNESRRCNKCVRIKDRRREIRTTRRSKQYGRDGLILELIIAKEINSNAN